MHVFTATLVTETNTFSPIPTGMDAFRRNLLARAGQHPDRPTLFTGPLWAARQRAKERNWRLSEGLCAVAEPGGITARATYEALRNELLDDLRQALPVDVVALQLHGAMMADGYDDCEADVLARVRALVGPDVVVGVELDSHCHLSAAMLTPADVVVIFKEYPHTDTLERAYELIDLCAAAAARDIRPVMATFDCRMTGIYHTPRQPMRGFVDKLKALEGKDGILSISVAQGFPHGDNPDMGTRILVVSDGDRAGAEKLASELGRELIGLRGTTTPEYLTVDQALDRASAIAGRSVLADTADNAGAGAPSDSTFVLKRILERGLSDVCIGPFWDPVAVRFAHEAGQGAQLRLRLGGKVGPVSGDPLDLEVTVLRVVQQGMQSFGVNRHAIGDAAGLRIEHARAERVDVAVIDSRVQAFGTDLFSGLGIEPTDKKFVVVKSMQHFYAAFAPLAEQVLYIGGPGAGTADYAKSHYTRIVRPMWPFDPHPLD